jgi:hypothetical protein
MEYSSAKYLAAHPDQDDEGEHSSDADSEDEHEEDDQDEDEQDSDEAANDASGSADAAHSDDPNPSASEAYREFLQFLQLGCYGSPVQGYPAVLVVLASIPPTVSRPIASLQHSSDILI